MAHELTDGGTPGRCVYGCAAVGGDVVRHYFACPIFSGFMLQGPARTPGWMHEGHMRIVSLTLPLSPNQDVLSGIWAYLACNLFCEGRARDRPYGGDELDVTARASLRSLCTRAPKVHRALYGEDVDFTGCRGGGMGALGFLRRRRSRVQVLFFAEVHRVAR